ncbi:MAG: RDD family protein [Chloroflexota bacterium]|nr:RDD family protein [Chloroflexota bacterium]
MTRLEQPVESCPRCQTPNQLFGIFCTNCNLYLRDESRSVERVTYTRRIFGSWLLESILFVFTLIIGWFIWLIFTSRESQSPAKSLTKIYIINVETGRAVDAGTVWLRDVVLKIIVASVVPFGSLVDGIWVLVDRDRQALHDKIIKTVPVYAPAGLPEAMLYMPGAPALYQAPAAFPATQAAAAPTVTDVSEQLRELKRLHDDQLISDEEYERKRTDLASRL